MTRVTRISDWFPTGELFEETMADAVLTANAEGLQKTLASLVDLNRRWQEYGLRTRMSEAEYHSLCRIAGIDPEAQNCREND